MKVSTSFPSLFPCLLFHSSLIQSLCHPHLHLDILYHCSKQATPFRRQRFLFWWHHCPAAEEVLSSLLPSAMPNYSWTTSTHKRFVDNIAMISCFKRRNSVLLVLIAPSTRKLGQTRNMVVGGTSFVWTVRKDLWTQQWMYCMYVCVVDTAMDVLYVRMCCGHSNGCILCTYVLWTQQWMYFMYVCVALCVILSEDEI